MRKSIVVALGAAFAAAAIGIAAPAHADPFDYTDNPSPFAGTNPSPFDFTGDVIELPILGPITFTGHEDGWGQGYQGKKSPGGHEGGRTEAENPSS